MTEEARKAVEALRICHSNEDCRDCKFIDSDKDEMSCVNVLFVKAADLIETLSAQLEQVTRERDAAVEDVRLAVCDDLKCSTCMYKGNESHMCDDCDVHTFCNWQWRSVEVNNDAQKGSDAKS